MKKNEIRSKLLNLEKKLDANGGHKIKNKKLNMPVMIITELFAGIIVGATIGYFIDKFFKTLPIFVMLCSIFGFFASLLNIYRNLYTRK
jgi:F0F1-type ATP synthase assembly protein I